MRNLYHLMRWCLYVLPPPLFILLPLLPIGVFEYLDMRFAKPMHIPELDAIMMKIQLAFSGFLCFSYGVFRAATFHPFYRRSYGNWLATIPWTSRKPLPFGPILLIPQDLVLLGLVYWYISSSPFAFPVVVLASLGPYLIVLGYSFFSTGVWQFGYALAFGLGAVALCAEQLQIAVLVMLGCYVIAFWGIHAMLSKFPWEETWESTPMKRLNAAGKKLDGTKSLGWHFERLAPLAKMMNIPIRHRILFPLLLAWLCFAAIIHAHDDNSRWQCLPLCYIFPCALAVFLRLGVYCFYYHNPRRLFGRIYPGPLIIPRYDKVFLVPLGMVVFAVAVPLVLWHLGLHFALLLPFSLMLVFFLAMNGKPSLKNWALTGGHRIAAIPRRMVKLRT